MIKNVCLFIGILIAGWLTCPAGPAFVFGEEILDSLERPALKDRDPSGRVLLDVTLAGSRLVAVGERGIIIYSDDSGATWEQADVPVSISLTAVFFPSLKVGWAVGHAGVVLHTTDGGETWNRQMEGVAAARLAYDTTEAYAELKGPEDKIAQRLLRNAQLLVDDGPDKPFLDLYFKNNQEGFIVGAYGLIFRTRDGGNTWESIMDQTENVRGMHFYAICYTDGIMYLAGEQGIFLISTDDGDSFRQIEMPYTGTYFALEKSSSDEIVVAGLLGNAFWTADQGATFNKIDVPVEVSFSAATRTEDGSMIFSNQAGMILISRDNGHTMTVLDVSRLAPISGIVPLDSETLMTVGYGGAIPVKLTALGSQENGGQK